MRVLFFNSVCGIRSTGRICAEAADSLSAEGHICKIAYGRENYVPEKYHKYAVRIGTDIDVKLHALSSRLFDNHGLCSNKATEDFLAWAENFNPNLLWLHNIHGYYINYERLFIWIKSRPEMQVYWTLHDCWSFTGHCAYFTYANCDRWKTLCEKCPQKGAYPKSFLLDRSRANFIKKKQAFIGVENMKLITPSQWLANLVKQSFLKEYPVEVDYNTVDTTIFKPTYGDFRIRYGINEKKVILGVASVWDARKGLEDFLRLSKMIDDTTVIVLVGLTKKQIKKLPPNIIGIERTNNPQELAEIYTMADVFFNPTYEDNYPTVNLEAQLCGTKVVTYDTGGSAETKKTDEFIVLKPGDIHAVLLSL